MEHTLLLMHGQLIKGSGLDSILQHSKLSTEGTSAIVDANDIKRSRYCVQVSIVTIYNMLKDAHAKSGSSRPIFEWLDERAKTSQMCFYWKMILNFEIQYLMFVRSLRQGNFNLYLSTLHRFLKWLFALDRFHYARWATIFWFLLVLLQYRCPNEYKQFLAGNFSFLKTNTEFSRMGLDQLHEQNNKFIKGVSGATSLINRADDSALIRWELCGPEICRILQDFEASADGPTHDNDRPKKHHENNPTFKKDFSSDTARLFKSFPENPFLLEKLTVINNTDTIFEDNIFYNLTQLESTGTKQFQTFIKDRLVMSKVSICTKIVLNHFMLPGSAKSTRSRQSLVDKRLNQAFLTKLRAAIQYRRQHAKLLFSSEVYNYSQSLSEDGSDLYHGTKSSILQRFDITPAKPPTSTSAALIVELSPLFRKTNHTGSFEMFSQRLFNEIRKISIGFSKVDVVCDRYFKDSLKNLTRIGRGDGPSIMFEDTTPLPGRFNETFLKNNDNKERLNLFLADKFLSYDDDKVRVITKGETILSNDDDILMDTSLSHNSAEEADQKLVRHMIQTVTSGVDECVVRTVDTDVIVSLISYRQLAGNYESKVLACLSTTSGSNYYDINKISVQLGNRKCRALPFWYAFTGCDIVSSFYNQGKCKFWDRWSEFEDEEGLTDVFITLSEKPVCVNDEQLSILERYVGFVYYGKEVLSIDIQRLKDFEHSLHGNLKMIPPSRAGLKEQVKRAAYYSGWVNYQSVENITLPSPTLWGWKMVNGMYQPVWDSSDSAIDADVLTSVCGCFSQKCLSCKCAKSSLTCLPYCRCERKCIYNKI